MKGLLLILCLLVAAGKSYGQYSPELQKVVNKLKKQRTLDIAEPGMPVVDNDAAYVPCPYENYLSLNTLANSQQLLELTRNKNEVLSIYALWTLIKRNDPLLDSAFLPFLDKKTDIYIMAGCSGYPGNWYSETHHLLSQCCASALQRIDSIVLHTQHKNHNMLQIALRANQDRFLSRIEFLAFIENQLDAILYLDSKRKVEYKKPIRDAVLAYMSHTELKYRQGYEIDSILEILLAGKEQAINEAVVNKLRSDTAWKTKNCQVDEIMAKYGLTGYK